MTYPVFDTSHINESIDGRYGPITCANCGCRLQRAADGEEVWYHFAPLGGRDARGDLVDCAEAPHDVHGRALAIA